MLDHRMNQFPFFKIHQFGFAMKFEFLSELFALDMRIFIKNIWNRFELAMKKKNIFKPTEANVIKFQSMEWEVNCVWFRNKIIALFSRMSSHSPWKQVNSGPAMFNLIWYVHISRSAIRFKITASIQIIKFSATLSKLS